MPLVYENVSVILGLIVKSYVTETVSQKDSCRLSFSSFHCRSLWPSVSGVAVSHLLYCDRPCTGRWIIFTP